MNIFDSDHVNPKALPGTRRLAVLADQPASKPDRRYAAGLRGDRLADALVDFEFRRAEFKDDTKPDPRAVKPDPRAVKPDPAPVIHWHEGAPPCVGWWNASCFEDRGVFRYWDGQQWSGVARDAEAASAVGPQADPKSIIKFRHARAPWDVDADGYHPYVPAADSKCPCPSAQRVIVKLRAHNGKINEDYTDTSDCGVRHGRSWIWNTRTTADDQITAYKVLA